MKSDYLIVGAGPFGAAFARRVAENGRRGLVIDRRNHLAGNCYTECVEVMAPVWTRAAWPRWYNMLRRDNPWGWGYDRAARSACGNELMGIVDCTPMRHLMPFTRLPEQLAEMRRFFTDHPEYDPCEGHVLGSLVGAEAASK